jgi:hypothetical protein
LPNPFDRKNIFDSSQKFTSHVNILWRNSPKHKIVSLDINFISVVVNHPSKAKRSLFFGVLHRKLINLSNRKPQIATIFYVVLCNNKYAVNKTGANMNNEIKLSEF